MRWSFVLLAFLALAAACGRDEVVLPDTTAKVAARDGLGRLVFTVTKDSYVRHAGRRVTLDEVAAVLESDESLEPRALRADADAKWGPVQWTIATLAPHACDLLVAEPDLPRGAVPVRTWFEPGYEGSMVAVEVPATPHPTYRVGRRTTGRPADVVRWCRDAAALHRFLVIAVEADFHTPFRRCAAVLVALHRAGFENVALALEEPHPWVRRQSPLPIGDGFPRIRYVTDLDWLPVEHMCLPVARMAQRDRNDDPDDRVIVELNREGKLRVKDYPVTLAVLSDALADLAREYGRKMRQRGERGFERAPDGSLWSRLFVLVRAQKDVPWRDVQWILAELHDAGFYKVQFAASRSANRAYTPDEAAALGVDWEPSLPTTLYSLDCKMPCFLPTAPPREQDFHCDVFVARDGERITYTQGERTTARAADLLPWIRAWFSAAAPGPHRKVLGRIQALPDVPFKHVVAALDQFHEAGLEKVDLAGIARAPEEVRSAERLPR